MTYVFCNKRKGKWVPVPVCETKCRDKGKCMDLGARRATEEAGPKEGGAEDVRK